MNQVVVVLACAVFGAGFFMLGWMWGQWLIWRNVHRHIDAITKVVKHLAEKRSDE